MSVAAFAAAAADRGIEGHSKLLAFYKAEYGLSHGNANAVALRVRELAAGGPAGSDALLDAQYAGGKAALRPVYERLAELASGLGPDVEGPRPEDGRRVPASQAVRAGPGGVLEARGAGPQPGPGARGRAGDRDAGRDVRLPGGPGGPGRSRRGRGRVAPRGVRTGGLNRRA